MFESAQRPFPGPGWPALPDDEPAEPELPVAQISVVLGWLGERRSSSSCGVRSHARISAHDGQKHRTRSCRPGTGEPCRSPPRPAPILKSLKLANTTITLAEAVAAGPFVPPGRAGGPPPAAAPAAAPAGRGGAPATPPLMLPAYCRVAATLTPSSDSDIKIEVWLPSEGWNGKYPGGRQRRLGGHHQLSGDGCGAA